MKDNKKLLGSVSVILRLAVSLIKIFMISVIIGAGLLNVLGFEYISIWSVVIFFCIYTMASIFVEPLVEIYVMVISEIGGLNKVLRKALSLIFGIGFDIVLISLIESNIYGIRISNEVIILYSIITYICGEIFSKISDANIKEEISSEKNVRKKFFVKKKSNNKEE